jgi:ABC-type nickel/cobalt efflux system permease component RcnA
LPATGPFKWIADAQRAFYAMLTTALARLKTDNTAFVVLGGLSFLYGIVHAAGPGHGKVVIGSYMLASDARVRRGLVLSFAAAMVQAVVAVAFVLVAALLLNLTSLAMSAAAEWVVAASYGLVMLLGLWLVVRRFTGNGHAHRHDMRERAHAHLHAGEAEHRHHDHDHEHDHVHHAITPDQARGHWREQLGVVLAVGMRPCSGSLVVLAFALSQGLLAAGILAVFLMALGTALTVALLAVIAISAKGLASRLVTADGTIAGDIVWWLELFGALAVFAFGAVLFTASFF